MKDFWKFAAVGVAGYLVGFYEIKYKTQKSLLNVLTEKDQEDSNEEKEEEAQSSSFSFSEKIMNCYENNRSIYIFKEVLKCKKLM